MFNLCCVPCVFDRHKTDFYVLHRYPAAIRPFYMMPCWDDRRYSNSFDVFIRGVTSFLMFSLDFINIRINIAIVRIVEEN